MSANPDLFRSNGAAGWARADKDKDRMERTGELPPIKEEECAGGGSGVEGSAASKKMEIAKTYR